MGFVSPYDRIAIVYLLSCVRPYYWLVTHEQDNSVMSLFGISLSSWDSEAFELEHGDKSAGMPNGISSIFPRVAAERFGYQSNTEILNRLLGQCAEVPEGTAHHTRPEA